MARPKKLFTEDQITEIGKLAGHGLTQEQIADFYGMSQTTFNERLKDQPGVSVAYKKGRAQVLSDIGESVVRWAKAGKEASAFFYLKTQGGWKEVSRQEHTGADGGPIQEEVTQKDDPREYLLGELDRIAHRETAGKALRRAKRN